MAKKAEKTVEAGSVEYNKDTLSLLNSLCSISESVIIEKKEENIVIQRANNAKTVAYRFVAPTRHFGFKGDKIAFYNFTEFSQLVHCFENPKLKQTGDKIVISQDNSNITYLSSDADTILKGPNKISFEKPDVTVEFKASEIKDIRKMIGLLKAENTRFACNGDDITMTLYNSNHDNSFSKKYTALKGADEFELAISSEIFTVLPDGDYIIEIKKEGIIKFGLKNEAITLELFTAELD
jgi:hypothetical protein